MTRKTTQIIVKKRHPVLRSIFAEQISWIGSWLFGITLVYWLCLTYLLLTPEPYDPLATHGFRLEEVFQRPDLLMHFAVFVTLGALLHLQKPVTTNSAPRELESKSLWHHCHHLIVRMRARLPSENNRKSLLLLAIIYSLATELAQYWIPNRFASLSDATLNLLGLLCGWTIVRLLRRSIGPLSHNSPISVNS